MLSHCLTVPYLGHHQAWRKFGFPRAEAQPLSHTQPPPPDLGTHHSLDTEFSEEQPLSSPGCHNEVP